MSYRFSGSVGNKILISSQTASSSSSIEFKNLATYDIYYLDFYNVQLSTNATLLAQYSTDNGANYSSTGYSDQSIWNNNSLVGTTQTGAGSTILLSYASGSSLPAAGNATFYHFNNSSDYKSDIIFANYWNGTSQIWFTNGGYWATTTVVNAFQIIPDSGNISQGTFKLYGIQN